MTLHTAAHLIGWACIAVFWTAGSAALAIVAPGLWRGIRYPYPASSSVIRPRRPGPASFEASVGLTLSRENDHG